MTSPTNESAQPSQPEPAKARSYKETLNLPSTKFGMKANLVQNEPATLKRWTDAKVYESLRAARAGRPSYVFHDGPPYANGSIHLGHLLNKVLKDIVVRSRSMMNFDCPYIPGWDCHGLPIEHKVVSDLGPKAREMSALQIRYKCKDYAEKFVKLQSGQMKRLLTLADYENPYLTMQPAYEKASLEVFADMVGLGLVYRALKPVHWSIANQTALADAELEYFDRQDTSVYVLFEVVNSAELPGAEKLPAGVPLNLMIWTTTPWTLPANLAVAGAERAEYGVYQFEHAGQQKLAVIAADLAAKVLAYIGAEAQPILTVKGKDLGKLRYKHPFIDRTSPMVFAEYVTLEDGTGLVHTAPGHGVEDYQTGLKEKIRFSLDKKQVLAGDPGDPLVRADTYCPVREDGTYDPTDTTIPEWLRAEGVDVWKANGLVVEKMKADGTLFHDHQFMHSYPHDWRSKTPIIFRATEQWFVNVDMPFKIDKGLGAGFSYSIRQRALWAAGSYTEENSKDHGPEADSTNQFKKMSDNLVKHYGGSAVIKPGWDGIANFYPEWGRNRLRGMLESRPDWCISRQRAWGLAIPAFFNEQGEPLLTKASVLAVAANVGQQGSDLWFKADAAQALAGYDPKADPDAPAWAKSLDAAGLAALKKSSDIFDVWFDSGTSWAAVIRQRGLGHKTGPITDLYLEGSDQHRGWFQASLLPAIATTGNPPYKNLLTHGFMVDKDGRKMSKSLGNALEVDTLLKDHGADVCRWWVSSINTDNDIKVDPSFFKLAGEEYRKVRNTLRYLLSNLYDFDPQQHKYTFTDHDATSIDAWILDELNKLIKSSVHGYEKFAFKEMNEGVFKFCNETLSAVYMAATKDRTYCDRPDSPRRRRTQTAMYEIASALIRLIAPVLTHTADEAWASLTGKADGCVHLELFPSIVDVSVHSDWGKVMRVRSGWLKLLETYRQVQKIDNPLDMGLHVPAVDEGVDLRPFCTTDLADLCGVSLVQLSEGAADARVLDLREHHPKCERSWKRDGTVKTRSDGGLLSDRDAEAVGVA